jgi:tetratricopeptide (TPR) repeat protein
MNTRTSGFPLILRALALLVVLAGPGCATMKLNLQAVGLMAAYDDIKAGRLEAAMAEVEKLERRNDVTPEVRSETAYVKARVLDAQGRLPEAIAQYRTVVDTYPNTPDGYLARKRLKELKVTAAP